MPCSWLARTPWYPIHDAATLAVGRTLLEDQQLAGLLMWIPAGAVYMAAVTWLFLGWIRRDEQRTGDAWRRDRGASSPAAFRRPHESLVLSRMCASLGGTVLGCAGAPDYEGDPVIAGGDAGRGKVEIAAYGCGSCHTIPGVRGADGVVGPSLEHWAELRIIAGEVPNDPARLITWITVPQSIEPGTAMPNLGVSDAHARDIATYLHTLH